MFLQPIVLSPDRSWSPLASINHAIATLILHFSGAITSFLRHNNKDKLFQEMLDEKETRSFNEIKKQAFPSYPSSEQLKSAFRGSEWDVVCVINWLVSKELNRLVDHGIILEKGFVELGLGTEAGNDEEEINSDYDANKQVHFSDFRPRFIVDRWMDRWSLLLEGSIYQILL